MTWQPDWSRLDNVAAACAATSPLPTTVATTTPAGGFTFTGLHAGLTDVLAAAGKGPFPGGLTIAVDTLTVPPGNTTVAASGLMLTARSVQVDGSGTATITVDCGEQGNGLQLTCASVATGVRFALSSRGTALGTSVSPSTSGRPTVFTLAPTAPSAAGASTAPADLADVVHSSACRLVLEESYAAAAALSDDDDPAAKALATDMLRWVTGCGSALLTNAAEYPILDLSSVATTQAAAVSLLTYTQASTSGATYVPVLSTTYYTSQVNGLLAVSKAYDDRLTALQTQAGISKELATFAATLKSINATGETPLYNSLVRMASQVQAVQSQLKNNVIQLSNLSDEIPLLQDNLTKAIEAAFQDELVEAAMKTLFTLVTLYISIGAIFADAPELVEDKAQEILKTGLEVAEKLVEAGENAIENAIAAGQEAADTSPDAATSATIETGANAMAGALLKFAATASALWVLVSRAIAGGQAKLDHSPAVLAVLSKQPDVSGFSIGGIDPTTYWDTVVTQVTNAVTPYLSKDAVAEPAKAYLEAVQLAAAYGRGAADQQMQLLALYSQGMAAYDRLVAAYQADDRWTGLQADLTTQDQRVAAASAFLERGYTAVKRDLVLAVGGYRAAFAYQWLQPSSIAVDPSMTYAQLAAAAQGSVTDLGQVLSGSSGGPVRPRQKFQSVHYDARTGREPLFTPVHGEGQAQWTISVDDPTLADQVNKNPAIFLSEAKFELLGAAQTGDVELTIRTDGTYANRLDSDTFRFVSRPIEMSCVYRSGPTPHYVTKWAFADAQDFMMPTPYTQWTIRVSKGNWQSVTGVRMTLAGVFLQNQP